MFSRVIVANLAARVRSSRGSARWKEDHARSRRPRPFQAIPVDSSVMPSARMSPRARNCAPASWRSCSPRSVSPRSRYWLARFFRVTAWTVRSPSLRASSSASVYRAIASGFLPSMLRAMAMPVTIRPSAYGNGPSSRRSARAWEYSSSPARGFPCSESTRPSSSRHLLSPARSAVSRQSGSASSSRACASSRRFICSSRYVARTRVAACSKWS